MTDCPSCGQQNGPNMAFCIYCGESMKGKAPVLSAPVTIGTGVTCPSCGQADLLNSQFCIFCGARTSRNTPSGNTSAVQADLSVLMQDLDRGGRKSSALSLTYGGAPLLIVLAVLGLTVGAGIGVLLKTLSVEQANDGFEQGLVVYSGKPYTHLFIELPGRRDFLIGNAGPQGALAISDLVPGSYLVTVRDADGKSITQEATVGTGKPSVLGSPEKPLI